MVRRYQLHLWSGLIIFKSISLAEVLKKKAEIFERTQNEFIDVVKIENNGDETDMREYNKNGL